MCRIAQNDGTILLSSSDERWGTATSRYDGKNDANMRYFNGLYLPANFGQRTDNCRHAHHGKLKCRQAFAEWAARAFAARLRRFGFAALANEIGEVSVVGREEKMIEFGNDVVGKKRREVHHTQQRERRRDDVPSSPLNDPHHDETVKFRAPARQQGILPVAAYCTWSCFISAPFNFMSL